MKTKRSSTIEYHLLASKKKNKNPVGSMDWTSNSHFLPALAHPTWCEGKQHTASIGADPPGCFPLSTNFAVMIAPAEGKKIWAQQVQEKLFQRLENDFRSHDHRLIYSESSKRGRNVREGLCSWDLTSFSVKT